MSEDNERTVRENRKMRPLLRWAGGKTWFIPYLSNWRRDGKVKFNGIVELFAGGAAVSFGMLNLDRVHLNDINQPLIWFYETVKCVDTKLTPAIDFKNSFGKIIKDKASYTLLRDVYNGLRQEIKTHYSFEKKSVIGLYFYLLNRTCFNGLYRENKKGEFNVPYGYLANPKLDWDATAYAKKMAGWTLSNLDYSLWHPTNDDLIFADPPYDNGFVSYNGGGFDFSEQEKLVKKLLRCNWITGAPVVATNLATKRMVELYKDHHFYITLLNAPRRISSDGNRDSVQEMVATSFKV